MKKDNPFDAKLEVWGNDLPDPVRGAMVHLTDSLDLCWAAVQAVFEDRAQPEQALALLAQLESRLRLPEPGRGTRSS